MFNCACLTVIDNLRTNHSANESHDFFRFLHRCQNAPQRFEINGNIAKIRAGSYTSPQLSI